MERQRLEFCVQAFFLSPPRNHTPHCITIIGISPSLDIYAYHLPVLWRHYKLGLGAVRRVLEAIQVVEHQSLGVGRPGQAALGSPDVVQLFKGTAAVAVASVSIIVTIAVANAIIILVVGVVIGGRVDS